MRITKEKPKGLKKNGKASEKLKCNSCHKKQALVTNGKILKCKYCGDGFNPMAHNTQVSKQEMRCN